MHIGGVSYEVQDLRNLISQKADKHEIYQTNSNVDGLERTIRELRAEIDGLRTQLQEQAYQIEHLDRRFMEQQP